ncbi:hypothetical protein [Acinetobacter sp. YH12123]|uniref:hypothetical protein n=1 Tax=Acinetobacter sp. YH12123 TaxID=2601108 RepID=UPI00211E4B51|nr:hypothetical protein [Acinetobacter sp. YH12123]
MIFQIKNKHAEGFKIWLEKLGYVKKVLADGSCTFSGKGTRKALSYVFVKNDLTGNAACQVLFDEYEMHLRSPAISDETNENLARVVANQIMKVA